MERPELRTERLVLRGLIPDDWEPMRQIVSDYSVVSMLASWPFPFEEERLHGLFESNEAEPTRGFAIEFEGRCVGTIGTGPSVGFMLSPDEWDKGIMTEALEAVEDYALDTLGREAIKGTVLLDNPASVRVFEKRGWREVAVGETECLARGQTLPVRVFVCCRRYDWLDPIETERLLIAPCCTGGF